MANETGNQKTAAPETRICAFDAGVETRLSCTQCETPICPKCMIPAEVGFKCRNCVRGMRSHVEEVSRAQFLKAAAAAAAIGFFYGWVHPLLLGLRFFMIFGIPVLGMILAYALGKLAGGLAQRASGNKLGAAIRACVLVAVLAGMLLGPMGRHLLGYLPYFSGPAMGLVGGSAEWMAFRLLIEVAAAMLFVRGMLAPFNYRR